MHLLFFSQLRACLGMQIVACCASVFNIILSIVKMETMSPNCWFHYYENLTRHYVTTCQKIEVSF